MARVSRRGKRPGWPSLPSSPRIPHLGDKTRLGEFGHKRCVHHALSSLPSPDLPLSFPKDSSSSRSKCSTACGSAKFREDRAERVRPGLWSFSLRDEKCGEWEIKRGWESSCRRADLADLLTIVRSGSDRAAGGTWTIEIDRSGAYLRTGQWYLYTLHLLCITSYEKVERSTETEARIGYVMKYVCVCVCCVYGR